MAKKKSKIDFEDISNKLSGMEEKQHIDQISPAISDVYTKHAKYKDKKGVTRFKRKFNKKEAENLADDLYDTLGYHTHRRFFGMGNNDYKGLMSIKDPNGKPYADSVVDYHFKGVSRKGLKKHFASDETENYISASGIKKQLEEAIGHHSSQIAGGILDAANLGDPKHMDAIKGAIDNIVSKYKLSKKTFNTKKMHSPEEVLSTYTQLAKHHYGKEKK